MPWRRGDLLRIALLAGLLLALPAGAESIVGGSYAAPVERYGHFALGRPHEYASLVAKTDGGRILELALPEDEVFEDLVPRVVRLAPGEPAGLLAIVSRRRDGSRLVLVGLGGAGLRVIADSPAIGRPNRWLNPVGVADLDGDGQAEIAAVITPHIGGTLKVYRRNGSRLKEIAALEGFSNHVYGSSDLDQSAVVTVGGAVRLMVPDAGRREWRLVALRQGRLVETGRCPLSAPLARAFADADRCGR